MSTKLFIAYCAIVVILFAYAIKGFVINPEDNPQTKEGAQRLIARTVVAQEIGPLSEPPMFKNEFLAGKNKDTSCGEVSYRGSFIRYIHSDTMGFTEIEGLKKIDFEKQWRMFCTR